MSEYKINRGDGECYEVFFKEKDPPDQESVLIKLYKQTKYYSSSRMNPTCIFMTKIFDFNMKYYSFYQE